MRFEFATATRILCGEGVVCEVAPVARQLGTRALVVTGQSEERSAPLRAELAAAGFGCHIFRVKGEPAVEDIQLGAEIARAEGCDLVIGFGGGGALDSGKAIAALMTNAGKLLDYLEVIGGSQPLRFPPAPFIAVPTTAGTGAEVTRNAVLASRAQRVKVSLRSPLMLPRFAVVDPELTLSLPPEVTARTGLDAVTQLIEPYVSKHANALTDGFCMEGLARARHALRRAYHDGHDRAARADMSVASLLGGLALANAGLGVVHGFAGPVGGMFPAPHGAVCAALLPSGIDVNLRALRGRDPSSESLGRYETVARLLTGRPQASAEDLVEWTFEICRELQVPPLRAYGVGEDDWPVLIDKASRASSMKGNPIALTSDELRKVLARACG
ncbi:MAG TPA: iron-containing alcohol dehydrogenase [Terriglobia bacterium]|nr:iron-containing alcohol dehydrogenase [Terriglobia bacterium]